MLPSAKAQRDLNFRNHRKCVLNTKWDVKNNHLQKLRTPVVTKMNVVKADVPTCQLQQQQNKSRLHNVDNIFTFGGALHTFNRTSYILSVTIQDRLKRARHIECENYRNGQRILSTKGQVNTRTHIGTTVKPHRRKKEHFEVPEKIIHKYDAQLILPENRMLVKKLFRPRIHMNLKIQNLLSLGRLIIELYTEASPQVVLEFVRVCQTQSAENLAFIRNFPSLWIEGELKMNDTSWAKKNIEFDKRALDHGSASGILSHSTKYLGGFKSGLIDFTLSYKPLSVLNGKRIAFGVVKQGKRILDAIESFGNKNGKLKNEVHVTRCGVYH